MERMPRLRQAEEKTEDASTAAEQYVEDLKALIPAVLRQLGKAQATYKRAFDASTKIKNNSVEAGYWVYLDAHFCAPKKLGFETQGPYMVLQADGQRFLVESPRGLRTVSSEHVTSAPCEFKSSKEKSTRREAKPLILYGDRDQSIVRETEPTPLGGATTGDRQSRRRTQGTPGHRWATKSPTPMTGPIARIIVLATVLVGRIKMRP